MSDSSKAKVMMEQGATFVPMAALTDSGDHITFTSAGTLWSDADGKAASVLPNGLISGGLITVGSGNDNVAVAALTCNLNGVADTSVSADATNAVGRPAGAFAKITSVTVNAAGAIAVINGADSASSAFSETRGAAGGPPFIPVDSIEIGQVRVTTQAAAPITTAQIFQVLNQHMEKFDFPGNSVNSETGKVAFDAALPLIHTGSVPKAVHASFYTALLVELQDSYDFKPPENTHSVTSTQVYNKTTADVSSSLGAGSFTQRLSDGVNDPVVTFRDQTLWFKFFPNRNKTPYLIGQAKLGIGRTFPAGASNLAACTITSKYEFTNHSA